MGELFTNPNPFPYEGRILLVMNLPYDVSPTQVRDFLISKGQILRVDLEKDHAGQMNGMGFIEFNNPDDCKAALELNGTQFGGRTFKCKFADHPPPELTRFYIRQPVDRPVPDKVRQTIINEWKYGPSENKKTGPPKRALKHKSLRKRNTYKKPEDQNDRNSSGYSDYSDSGSYSYGSYSD